MIFKSLMIQLNCYAGLDITILGCNDFYSYRNYVSSLSVLPYFVPLKKKTSQPIQLMFCGFSSFTRLFFILFYYPIINLFDSHGYSLTWHT